VYSGGDEKVIRKWKLAANGVATVTLRLEGHTRSVHGISLSPDKRYMASADKGTTVRVWEVATGQQIRALEGHRVCAWSPDGQYIVCGSRDNKARVLRFCVQVWYTQARALYIYIYIYIYMHVFYCVTCVYVCTYYNMSCVCVYTRAYTHDTHTAYTHVCMFTCFAYMHTFLTKHICMNISKLCLNLRSHLRDGHALQQYLFPYIHTYIPIHPYRHT
jgi:hypothetical protein